MDFALIDGCEKRNIDYSITKRLSDMINLSEYNVIFLNKYHSIQKSTIVIIRVSSTILELLYMSKSIVYYHSDNKKVMKFQESMSMHSLSFDFKSLAEVFNLKLTFNAYYRTRVNNFLDFYTNTNPIKLVVGFISKYRSKYVSFI